MKRWCSCQSGVFPASRVSSQVNLSKAGLWLLLTQSIPVEFFQPGCSWGIFQGPFSMVWVLERFLTLGPGSEQATCSHREGVQMCLILSFLRATAFMLTGTPKFLGKPCFSSLPAIQQLIPPTLQVPTLLSSWATKSEILTMSLNYCTGLCKTLRTLETMA